MKIYILITTLFISTLSFGQTPKQGMKILLKEKTKGDTEIRIKNTKVEIILNDSIKRYVTTDNQGMLDVETSVGKFSVTVKKDSCRTHTFNGVIVGENKRAYITFEIECERYLNSLTKKELKKLGYK
jgi:hypothetical protein